MNYLEAKEKLAAYLEANRTYLNGEWAELMDKCFQAIVDCLDMGLDGEGELP